MLSSIDQQSGPPNWTSFQGTTIGDAFQIDSFLGADSRSAFFRGRVLGDLERQAIVKFFQMESEQDASEQIALWNRTSNPEHPNLIRVFGAGRAPAGHENLIYLALEAPDETLAAALEQRALDRGETAEVVRTCISALEHLHQNGLVHANLSPSQIWAVGDSIKLGTEGVLPLRASRNMIYETPKYLAPESNGLNNTPAADAWCLGASIREMLTRESAPAAAPNCDGLPAPFAEIAKGLLDENPETRLKLDKAAEILDAFDRPAPALQPQLVAVPPVAEDILPELPKTLEPQKASRPVFPPWAYALGLLVVILGLFWLFRSKPTKQANTPPPGQAASSLPSAQSRVITPQGTESEARKPNPTPSAPRTIAAETKARDKAASAQNQTTPRAPQSNTAKSGAVWRVIVYTYNRREDAEKKAAQINKAHPQLRAEAYSAGGSAPFLVAVGGAMDRDQARRIRQSAISMGMPRDSYMQNFSH